MRQLVGKGFVALFLSVVFEFFNEDLNSRNTIAAPIHATKSLNKGIERGRVANQVVGIEIESDLTCRCRDQNCRSFLAAVHRVQESLHDPAFMLSRVFRWLQKFVTLQSTHGSRKNGHTFQEGREVSVAQDANCFGEFIGRIRRPDENYDTVLVTGESGSGSDNFGVGIVKSIGDRQSLLGLESTDDRIRVAISFEIAILK